MPETVFKKITVTGCSTDSYEKAIEIAVEKTSQSLRGLSWFEARSAMAPWSTRRPSRSLLRSIDQSETRD